jgi:CRP-like cAMP-binding protein
MQQLLTQIKNYGTLSEAVQSKLKEGFEKVIIAKNDFLLQQGQVCRHLYFLEQGAVRGFYNLDGKEITHWFGFENDFVTSFHSFITQQAAVENIQLLEGSIFWRISKDTLAGLCDTHHEIERLLRIAYEKYYIRLEERFVNAQFKTAGERYSNLLQQTPHIIERVSLGCIASYLGISQETLSRIRSKY